VNPIDVMRYGHRQVMHSVDQFRGDDWTTIALGVWTAKDLVGHLGAFEVRFAEVLATFVGIEPATNLRAVSPATFNDDQAAIRKDWTVEQILHEFRQAHDDVMKRAAEIPATKWSEVGTIPWYGPEYSLEDLCVYQVYGHKREHEPQLSKVLERPDR
jgi:hypothetical protein